MSWKEQSAEQLYHQLLFELEQHIANAAQDILDQQQQPQLQQQELHPAQQQQQQQQSAADAMMQQMLATSPAAQAWQQQQPQQPQQPQLMHQGSAQDTQLQEQQQLSAQQEQQQQQQQRAMTVAGPAQQSTASLGAEHLLPVTPEVVQLAVHDTTGTMTEAGATSISMCWLQQQIPQGWQLEHVVAGVSGMFGVLCLQCSDAAVQQQQQQQHAPWMAAVWDGTAWQIMGIYSSEQQARSSCTYVLN
jgi:hypothetical protein